MAELYSVTGGFRPGVAAATMAMVILLGGSPASAQLQVRSPEGIITGQVIDSATGAPIPYALLILEEGNVRAFANDAGRFAIRAPSPGLKHFSARQIGYAPVQVRMLIELLPAGAEGSPPLTIRLSHRAFVLPDLVVSASSCEQSASAGDAESEALLSLAFENAERLLTLERTYPSRSTFVKEVKLLNADRERLDGWADTIRTLSLGREEYRAGRVIQGGKAMYFSAADIAGKDFRRHHCFWYGGRDHDSASGIPVVRINFVPTIKTKTPDWAGSLMLDSASSVLLRSEALLVNVPRRSTFASARCIVDYTQLAPTLVHESRAVCAIARATQPPELVVEHWTLHEHTFLGRRPDSSVVPPLP